MNPEENSENNIDKLAQDLYARDYKNEVSPRLELSQDAPAVERQWKHEPLPEIPKQEQKTGSISLFKRIFIVSVIFFLASAAIALIVFYGGFNIISTNKVEMDFVGPVSIAAGEELGFEVVVKNQNTTPLLNAELFIDYPNGTKEAVDLSRDLNHSKETIGTILPRTSATRTIRSVLFGKTQDIKDIKVTLQYELQSSNGIFKKEKAYQVAIASTPLTLTIEHQPEIGSGQEITFKVDVTSNSSVSLKNLLLVAEYPFGFEFLRGDPAPTLDTTVWRILVLQPGEKKTFTFIGKAEGEEGDERFFRFNVGAGNDVNEKQIDIVYLTAAESIIIRRPPIALSTTINEYEDREVIVEPGKLIQTRLELANNMTSQLVDTKVNIVLGGQALDPTSPDVGTALYRLPTRTISLDKTNLSRLARLGPGDTIDFSFSMASLPPETLTAIRNGTITISVEAVGTSVDTGQTIRSTMSRLIKVQPQVSLSSRLVYSIGPFKNTGVVPPKAETVTTYTVMWAINQSSNAITNGEVRAILPSYVEWLGATSPAAENITWNPDRNEVVWRVGDIPAGTVGRVAKEVAFQIAFKPSFSQIRTQPAVVQNITYRATDTFTKKVITISVLPLSTLLPADPKYQTLDGLVRP
ncbi:hypothetical protein KW782_02305 [Candidatus Parcubacteria bacterium]|nr:hypothetical protein [Candidatus Parcubacteria bacterium]